MDIIHNQILDQIKLLSYHILKNYNSLKLLEIEGRSESEEFKSLIQTLNRNLCLENLLYDKLGSNPNELSIILDDITMAALAWDLEVDYILLVENKSVDLVDRRIILKICDRINQSNIINPLMPLVVGNPNVDSSSYSYVELSVATRIDFINTILALLNEQIYNENDNIIRTKLVELKYNISFLYQFVEKDFLIHNFAINPELYWISPAVANIRQIGEVMVSNYQTHYAAGINYQIERLIEMSKKDLSEKDKYFNALAYQIIIRASLIMGKEGMIIKLEKYLSKNKYKRNSACFMLKDALNMYELDKELPRIVKLDL